jgi:invasion protein IalB
MFIDEELFADCTPSGCHVSVSCHSQNMAHLRSASGSGVASINIALRRSAFTGPPLGISKERLDKALPIDITS